MVAYSQKFFTPEQYLEYENRSQTRHEYFNGQIFNMAGGTPVHNQIGRNTLIAFGNALKGKPCEPFGSDQRLFIPATGMYTYPDVSVVCGEWELSETDKNAFINPRVLVEVLSPSTAEYDRTDKFAHYQTLSSLTDYLLISQHRILVEHSKRHEGETWNYQTYTQPEERILLESIGCELLLADLYDRVVLPLLELRQVVEEG